MTKAVQAVVKVLFVFCSIVVVVALTGCALFHSVYFKS